MNKWLNSLLIGMVIGFASIGIARCAHAAGDVAHVTVTLPTEYSDDTALPASDIAEIHVQWYRSGALVPLGEKVITPTQLTFDLPGMKCGDLQFMSYAITTATAKYPNALTIQEDRNAGAVIYSTGVKCGPKAPGLTVR